jgi:hypothetical protein
MPLENSLKWEGPGGGSFDQPSLKIVAKSEELSSVAQSISLVRVIFWRGRAKIMGKIAEYPLPSSGVEQWLPKRTVFLPR